nr:pitrilysin family protein [Virgisporangium aurantiacum]
MEAPVRASLANGLRVLLMPDRALPVIGVAVHYGVGFRSERPGYSGFAHLFEHLMFQGSESLPKLEHHRQVQAVGGSCNGSTHPDHTAYHNTAPAEALERVLFLEADRMRAPLLTEENLRNQVAVVKEEIRRNVLSRPYGGFPWIPLPQVLYRSFANTHNGYGDFVNLDRATLTDCAAFFDAYYAPANAVLTVVGDFAVDDVVELAERHFADVPARPVPDRPVLAEPFPGSDRRDERVDPLAPMRATAIGYRLPDPETDLKQYLTNVVLAAVLGGGHGSRLVRRTVHDVPGAMQVSAACGLFGRPFEVRDPDTLVITAIERSGTPADQLAHTVDEELADLAERGPADAELGRVAPWLATMLHREMQSVPARAILLGQAELLFGRAELVAELPGLVAEVTATEVAAAAKALVGSCRAILTVQPGAGR